MIKFIEKGKSYKVVSIDTKVTALSDAYTSSLQVEVLDVEANEKFSIDPHLLIEI